MTRPTVPDVLPLARLYYATHPLGGHLHIVLEDGNVKDSNVRFCLRAARDADDRLGVELATDLLKMTKTQRLKLGHLVHERTENDG